MCSLSTSTTRPVSLRSSSTGNVSAIHSLPVPVITSPRRFDAGLIRPKHAEVLLRHVRLHHRMKQASQHPRRFHILLSAALDLYGIIAEVWHLQRLQQQPAFECRISCHAQPSLWRNLSQVARKCPFSSKSSSACSSASTLQACEDDPASRRSRQRNLVRSPRSFHRLAVHNFGPSIPSACA